MSEVVNPESYADEQEALASELSDGIKIDAPTEPEVNPDIYKDVQSLLFRGFISVPAEINGVLFQFKSLNQHEMEMLRFICPDEKATQRFWSLFLAYGVFMVDGVNVLPDRERAIPKIADSFSEFTPPARQKVVRHLSEINRRASNAVILTECYAMEKYSRYRWYQLRGQDMTQTSVTGIPGTSNLGLNWAQLVWRALNSLEDNREQNEHSWEEAKFIGGCMAGKGISKVYQQDSRRKAKEKEEQIARKDRILRQVLLGEKFEGDLVEGGAVKIVASSTQDLAQQLERDLRGEKDWHDLVVDEHEARARAAQESRQAQLEEIARMREAEFGGKSLLGGSDMRGLTFEQVNDRIMKRAQAQTVSDLPEGARNIVGRFVDDLEPGVGQTNRNPELAFPVPNQRKGGTPFRR